MAQILELSGLWARIVKGLWRGDGLWLSPGKGSLQGGLLLEAWALTEELRVSTWCGQMVRGKAWDPEGFLPQTSLFGCLEAFEEARDVTA